MANLPSQHPSLAVHLADRTRTPLISSARSQQQAQALSTLTHSALLAHESALRLGLGSPQRVIVEHSSNGPFLIHSFIETDTAQHDALQEAPTYVDMNPGGSNQTGQSELPIDGEVDEAPMLLSTVIAPTSESGLDAKRAGARLERVGKAIQSSWTDSGSS
ncbi:hypothetical protein PG993_004731 [Apiospora rasikravindrae]|uniref:Uncharacterized protein n=1 Tax=Apiospora rasikravindrae TaxID=990691 RepID=A0ABR1TE84_9PEZI